VRSFQGLPRRYCSRVKEGGGGRSFSLLKNESFPQWILDWFPQLISISSEKESIGHFQAEPVGGAIPCNGQYRA